MSRCISGVSRALLAVCMHMNEILLILALQRKIADTLDAAISFRPHAVVTVDSKGFSFRLLQQLKCKAVEAFFYHAIISFKQPNLLFHEQT